MTPTKNVVNASRGLDACRLGSQAAPVLTRLLAGSERVSTGFSELDRALSGGIIVPALTVLGAKPKCGKSTFLLQLLGNIVLRGHLAYLVDRENGLDRVLRRIMCAQAKIDPSSLGDGFVPTDPWRQAEKLVLEGALGQRLFVETERVFDWRLLDSRFKELSELSEGRPFVAVLDSLQKLPLKSLNDRRAGVDGWMRALEYLRDKHRAVIVLSSELKRPPQGQLYKPNEVSLKESGDIEYSADLVLTFDRPETKDDEYAADSPPQPATMRIVFNRDGSTGRVADYKLEYPYHRIQEIPQAYYEGIRKANLASVTPIR